MPYQNSRKESVGAGKKFFFILLLDLEETETSIIKSGWQQL